MQNYEKFKKELEDLKISLENLNKAEQEYQNHYNDSKNITERLIDTIIKMNDKHEILEFTKLFSETSKISLDILIEQLKKIKDKKNEQ